MSNLLRSTMITLALLPALAGLRAGPQWEVGENAYIKLSILGQVHASFTEDVDDEHDVYLRRARIILSGQIADGVKFFTETDNDNAGRNGVSGVSTDIQDAFVEQRLGTHHFVQGGLILLPFSFENAASAASILGLDYNLETLKFAETFAWRDYGVVFRGALGERFAYRLGAFDGYDGDAGTKNDDAEIRGTGHLAFNLLGKAENGWFFSQEPLSDEPYFAIGAGTDYQDEATRIASTNDAPDVVTDNRAWVADFKSGFAAGPLAATLNGAWHDWENARFEGSTAFLEGGLRLDEAQVTCKFSNQDPDDGDELVDFTIGLHHLPHKHHARAGIEFRFGDSPTQVLIGFQVML